MKKPTNSAAFFKQSQKPHMQLTPVMAQLAQALPPGAESVEAPKGGSGSINRAVNGVIEVDLPGEPPPIIDNALALEYVEREIVVKDTQGGEYSFPIIAAVEKVPAPTEVLGRKSWPVPQIHELPTAELTDEIKQFLIWFKDRASVEKIVDPSREHAEHGPSSGERDVNCIAAMPLTYLVRRDRPKEDRTEYATEGHLAHEVAAAFVQARFEGKAYPYEKFNTKPYKPDMIKYAQDYAEYCHKACEPYLHLPHSWVIEERVCIDYVRDSWGTLDFGFVARDGDKLYAVSVDYKYGMGVDVDTENKTTGEKNWQLALYALGLIGKFLNVSDPENILAIHAVTAHIFQPRIDEVVPPVTFSLNELLEKYLVKYLGAVDTAKQFIAEIREAEQNAEVWDSSSIEGHQVVGKWCQFCKAKPICKAYQHYRGVPKAAEVFKKALDSGLIVKGEKEPVKKMWEQGLINAEDLAFLALNGSKMKGLLDECQDVAVELIQQGEELPDCVVEKTEGRRSWIQDTAEVAAVLKELGVENPSEIVHKLITITEAEKLVGYGKLDEITEKAEGGLKLVHTSKLKNPAAIGAGAALMFKKHFEGK